MAREEPVDGEVAIISRAEIQGTPPRSGTVTHRPRVGFNSRFDPTEESPFRGMPYTAWQSLLAEGIDLVPLMVGSVYCLDLDTTEYRAMRRPRLLTEHQREAHLCHVVQLVDGHGLFVAMDVSVADRKHQSNKALGVEFIGVAAAARNGTGWLQSD